MAGDIEKRLSLVEQTLVRLILDGIPEDTVTAERDQLRAVVEGIAKVIFGKGYPGEKESDVWDILEQNGFNQGGGDGG